MKYNICTTCQDICIADHTNDFSGIETINPEVLKRIKAVHYIDITGKVANEFTTVPCELCGDRDAGARYIVNIITQRRKKK